MTARRRGALANPVWVEVITRADWRCECAGECGRTHKSTGYRCGQRQDWMEVDASRAVLLVAPRDLTVPDHAAWRLPAAELAARCGPCLDAARRSAARKVAAARAVELRESTGELFLMGGAA